ncbi:hypothetical protein CRYUN_Cryun11dG0067300 [Craigia yunnanensis]
MNITFSLASKPCNGSLQFRKSMFTTARAEVITAPKISITFPGLTKQVIPHTDLQVQEIVRRQSWPNNLAKECNCRKPQFHSIFLEEAYEKCRNICEEYAKTFYLGPTSFPFSPLTCKELVKSFKVSQVKHLIDDRGAQKAIWTIYGTVGLMSVPIMGIAPESSVSTHTIYNSALYLGIGNQLTNILTDVGEDALRGRVYLPQDELAQFGLCDKDVLSRKVTDAWRDFMKEQITRARFYFNLAEGASQLDKASRWPVWSSLLLYRKILDAIEDNDYHNFTKRAYVGRTKKLLALPLAYSRAISKPGLSFY